MYAIISGQIKYIYFFYQIGMIYVTICSGFFSVEMFQNFPLYQKLKTYAGNTSMESVKDVFEWIVYTKFSTILLNANSKTYLYMLQNRGFCTDLYCGTRENVCVLISCFVLKNKENLKTIQQKFVQQTKNKQKNHIKM